MQIARNKVNARLEAGAGDRKDILSHLQAARDDVGLPLAKPELTAEGTCFRFRLRSSRGRRSPGLLLFLLFFSPRLQLSPSSLRGVIQRRILLVPSSSSPSGTSTLTPSSWRSSIRRSLTRASKAFSSTKTYVPSSSLNPLSSFQDAYVFFPVDQGPVSKRSLWLR